MSQLQLTWMYPPLAFARLGASPSPLANFHWGPADNRPRGTAMLTLQPGESLVVQEDGSLRSESTEHVQFKDVYGFRPACPFFELHGTWGDSEKDGGPITEEVLRAHGLGLADVEWTVRVSNRKPAYMTLNNDDLISATAKIRADNNAKHALDGHSPDESREPLIPKGEVVNLGWIQAIRSNEEFPGLRLRITPAHGLIYAPTNLQQRLDASPRTPRYDVPPERCILNPNATWASWAPVGGDGRTNPSSLYAMDADGRSLGLVDDVCDGIVECRIGDLVSTARVVVAPPDFQPDRRPFVSLADGLKDRVARADVVDDSYMESDSALARTNAEVEDLMQRAYETMHSSNLDFQNERARLTNRGLGAADGAAAPGAPFAPPPADLGDPLPLTAIGRRHHRRFVSFEVFKAMMREQPEVLERIRSASDTSPYYDARMPAVMRGSDRRPMHITPRQRLLLERWVERIRRDVGDE